MIKMKSLTITFLICSFVFLFGLQAYEYTLSVCCIFQNEADYLKEWIEYHKLLGVEHFYLYNHRSTDHYIEVLEPYIQSGEVSLTEWSLYQHPTSQLKAYSQCISNSKKVSKWLALIDVDEFVLPMQDDNLVEFLSHYEDHAGVGINWQLFGTSNYESLPLGELLIEHLIYKCRPNYTSSDWVSNTYFKSIVQPERIESVGVSAHIFKTIPGFHTVDPNYANLYYPSCANNRIPIDKIRINHYWFRTLDWFYETKIKRRADVGRHYSPAVIRRILKESNECYDDSIHKFLDRLKEAFNDEQEDL